MTGLSRQEAAEAVASLFDTTARHSSSSRTYDPWEITDNEGKIWRFVYDSSIHATHQVGRQQIPIDDGTYKVEMNSPKLEYREMGKLQEVVRVLRHAGAVVNQSCGMHVHVDASKHKMTSRPQKGRFRQQSEYIVWGSNGPMPISRPVGCLPGVFRYANPQNRTHVTEKPLQLMRDLVKICESGGRILDPFCGAGTTVLASRLEGYEAVGIEVTDAYYKLGSDRVRFALESHAE